MNKTKNCKHCQSDIPKNAKICPNCRKRVNGGKGKIVLIIVAILIILIAIPGKDSGSKSESNSAKTENEQNKEENKKDDGYLTVGSSFEKDGLVITINDADLNFTNYDDEFNMFDPADGMKYIMADFSFENKGKSDAYVSIYDFKCYADNNSCEQAYLPDDSNFINVNLSSGRNVSFRTYYEVPVDCDSIELEYETNIWTDKKVLIKLK